MYKCESKLRTALSSRGISLEPSTIPCNLTRFSCSIATATVCLSITRSSSATVAITARGTLSLTWESDCAVGSALTCWPGGINCESWLGPNGCDDDELKAVRNLPGLGPSYKFSAEVRFKAEELCKEQDITYVSMLLEDLSGKVIRDALKDMEDLLASCRRRIARKVDQADYDAAELLFNEDSAALLERQDELLAGKGSRRKERRLVSSSSNAPAKGHAKTSVAVKGKRGLNTATSSKASWSN